MSILLINPPTPDLRSLGGEPPMDSDYPPLGLGYLAAQLKGHDVKILDGYFLPLSEIGEAIKESRPRLVGISCLTRNRVNAYKIAQLAKSIDSDTIVVLGGHHASYFYDQILVNYPVDIVCLGESDLTFPELVAHLHAEGDLQEVQGIAYKRRDEIVRTTPRRLIDDLDSLPFPAYHLFDPIHRQSPPWAMVVTSRGCPFRCQYCSTGSFWGHRWRFRSPSNVVDEIEFLNKDYGIDLFYFGDDAFSIDQARAISICEEIIKRGLRIRWNCVTRADSVSREFFSAFKQAGGLRVEIGVESGSESILKTINKKVTPQKVRSAFKLAREAGIETKAFYMVGNPGECEESINRSYDLLKETRPSTVAISVTKVLPNTDLYRLSKKEGLVDDTYWLYELPLPYYTTEHSFGQLLQWARKLSSYRDNWAGKLVRRCRNIIYDLTGIKILRPTLRKTAIARLVQRSYPPPRVGYRRCIKKWREYRDLGSATANDAGTARAGDRVVAAARSGTHAAPATVTK